MANQIRNVILTNYILFMLTIKLSDYTRLIVVSTRPNPIYSGWMSDANRQSTHNIIEFLDNLNLGLTLTQRQKIACHTVAQESCVRSFKANLTHCCGVLNNVLNNQSLINHISK